MPEEKIVKEEAGAEKMLPQSQVDAIVQDRLAREKAKFSDYDDLRKFKTDYEKTQDARAQKELEDRKEYEKAKEGWQSKEKEYQGVISKKDGDINDMKITGSLSTEINKQNAYAEETTALLKPMAVIDKEGNIRIKGRDANGLEVMDSVEEGLKKFLTNRPHLVKATNKNGAGAGSGNPSNQNVVGDDLNSLNAALLKAQANRDGKASKELSVKIRAKLAEQGVRL
mgnify:CR=1 FL=1